MSLQGFRVWPGVQGSGLFRLRSAAKGLRFRVGARPTVPSIESTPHVEC